MNRAKGFTLLELSIVIGIIAVIMTTFLERVMIYQEQTEKASMLGVVTAVQDALAMQLGLLRVQSNDSGMVALGKSNPINWLAEKPKNYGGEFFDPTAEVVSRGTWVYDLRTYELIYFPTDTSHIVFTGAEKKWIRYRVHLVQSKTSIISDNIKVVAASFEAVEPYHWEN